MTKDNRSYRFYSPCRISFFLVEDPLATKPSELSDSLSVTGVYYNTENRTAKFSLHCVLLTNHINVNNLYDFNYMIKVINLSIQPVVGVMYIKDK